MRFSSRPFHFRWERQCFSIAHRVLAPRAPVRVRFFGRAARKIAKTVRARPVRKSALDWRLIGVGLSTLPPLEKRARAARCCCCAREERDRPQNVSRETFWGSDNKRALFFQQSRSVLEINALVCGCCCQSFGFDKGLV